MQQASAIRDGSSTVCNDCTCIGRQRAAGCTDARCRCHACADCGCPEGFEDKPLDTCDEPCDCHESFFHDHLRQGAEIPDNVHHASKRRVQSAQAVLRWRFTHGTSNEYAQQLIVRDRVLMGDLPQQDEAPQPAVESTSKEESQESARVKDVPKRKSEQSESDQKEDEVVSSKRPAKRMKAESSSRKEEKTEEGLEGDEDQAEDVPVETEAEREAREITIRASFQQVLDDVKRRMSFDASNEEAMALVGSIDFRPPSYAK